jgi:hypothetical protein
MYAADKVNRAVSTAIYFLLPAGSVSRLHRIPCAETWHFYKGEPLTVSITSCLFSMPKAIRQLLPPFFFICRISVLK